MNTQQPSPQRDLGPAERDPHPADGSGVEVSGRAARQGDKTGHMRWVLRIGLALVVIGFILAWFWA